MSRIIQSSPRNDLIKDEVSPLRITQWKYLIPYQKLDQLVVCVGYSVFTIHDITINKFHEINAENTDAYYAFDYLRSGLICEKCGGTGIIDWIGKAATGSEKTSIIYLNNVLRYVRKKKGIVNKFLTLENTIAYTSTPHKKMGEEYCNTCYGCGIKLAHFSHQGTTEFWPS